MSALFMRGPLARDSGDPMLAGREGHALGARPEAPAPAKGASAVAVPTPQGLNEAMGCVQE